jgi:phage/plasmid-like protein (TIGR03299 family)
MTAALESGFFVGTPAWHRLGRVVPNVESTEEGIKLAHLDWDVLERPVAFLDDTGEPSVIPEHKALVRETDGRTLGIVGAKYTPLQNREAFKFFDPVLAAGSAKLESAGSLKGGRRVWILAKLQNATAEVLPGDPVEAYLLLYNSFDGSTAVGVQFTTIRVVCQNTLAAARDAGAKGLEASIKIRHQAKLCEALDIVQTAVNASKRTFDLTIEQYRYLTRKNLTMGGLDQYLRQVFEVPAGEKLPRYTDYVLQSLEVGPGASLPGVSGTMWGAFNAVTDWLDHTRGRNAERRLESTWFGTGRAIRERAFRYALDA